MKSKDEIFTERVLEKIDALHSHVHDLFKGSDRTKILYSFTEPTALDESFEELRIEISLKPVCRDMVSTHEGLDQECHSLNMVRHKVHTDSIIIAWTLANETCQAFGLRPKDLSISVDNGDLSMLKLKNFKFFNRNEIKNLIAD